MVGTTSESIRYTGSADGQASVCFRIAGWVVDPQSGEMRRGAETLRLEPRVMELLVYLAAHQGEVVTRDELEGAVWAGTVVGYDALSGTVRKLRQALGDDARQPRIVETLSKRGYRLLAPVVPVHESAGGSGPSNGGATRAQTRLLGRWIAGVGIALWLALVVTIGILAWLGPWGFSRKTAATDTPSQSIVVLPFADPNAGPGQDLLVGNITDHLITILAANPALSVGTRDAASPYAGRGSGIRQMPGGLDVRYIVRGGVYRTEGGVRIHAELLDTHTGTILWTGLFEGAREDIARLQDQIARSIDSVLISTLKLRSGAK